MQLSDQQLSVLNSMCDWWSSKPTQVFTLAGYAGVGKTTIVKSFIDKLQLQDDNVEFLAFTGKAAGVLRKMGNRGACTLHKFLYRPVVERVSGKPKLVFVKRFENVDAETDARLQSLKLCVVDEASMVPGNILSDLLQLGIPVLLIGDPGQLPPITIKGEQNKFKTGLDFLYHPDELMTEIHRQARGNPIIKLSEMIREGQTMFNVGKYFDDQGNHRVSIVPSTGFWFDDRYMQHLLRSEQILVGSNKTRKDINNEVRRLMNYDKISRFPTAGEKLIVIKNNWNVPVCDSSGEIVDYLTNGTIVRTPSGMKSGSVDKSNDTFRTDLLHPDYNTVIPNCTMSMYSYMGKKFRKRAAYDIEPMIVDSDFAYAITVHKSQGSQFDTVIAFDESDIFGNSKNQWLYTAVTRASETLVLVTENLQG